MKTDFIIAIILAVAAIMGGIPMSLIPVIFPDAPKWLLKDIFYGCLVMTVILIFAAVFIASSRQEGQMFSRKKIIPFILMILCAVGFSMSLRWLLLQEVSAAPAEQVTQQVETEQPIIPPHSIVKVPEKKMSDDSKNEPVTISGNDNVVSVGQIGGITAKTVINQVVTPSLKILSKQEIDNTDGSHTVIYNTVVDAPFTPGLLFLQVQASGLMSVVIMPPAVGGVSTMFLRNKRFSTDFYSAEIPSPNGQYQISIKTAHRADIQLSAKF